MIMKTSDITLSLEKILFYLIIDVLALTLLVAIPVFSHWISFPLYLYSPMRFIVFCLIITTTRKNALLLALLLPFISTFISGHPIFPKNILISIELITNVLLFYKLSNLKVNTSVAIILSVSFSILLYYLLKYALITTGLLNLELISTPFSYQVSSLIVIILMVFTIKTIKEKGKYFKSFNKMK